MKKYLLSIAAILVLALAAFSFKESSTTFDDAWENYVDKVDALIASGNLNGPESKAVWLAIGELNNYNVDAEYESRFPFTQHYCVQACYYHFYNCVRNTPPPSTGGGNIGYPIDPYCYTILNGCLDQCGF